MVIGITMIKTAPDQEKAGFDALRETEGVKEIYNLFGEFDLFLILEALDRARLNLAPGGDSRPEIRPGYMAASGLQGREPS